MRRYFSRWCYWCWYLVELRQRHRHEPLLTLLMSLWEGNVLFKQFLWKCVESSDTKTDGPCNPVAISLVKSEGRFMLGLECIPAYLHECTSSRTIFANFKITIQLWVVVPHDIVLCGGASFLSLVECVMEVSTSPRLMPTVRKHLLWGSHMTKWSLCRSIIFIQISLYQSDIFYI